MSHYQYAITYVTPNSETWWQRHCRARANPIWVMLLQLAAMADLHRRHYESSIGEDGILGAHWRDMVQGLRGMLDGDCGNLDAGTIDHILCHMLETEGFEA